MPVRSRAATLLIVGTLLMASGVVLGPALASQTAPTVTAADSPATATQSSNVTLRDINTTMRIDVQPNGDTRWTVRLTTSLGNETSREDFESIAAAFEAGETAVLPPTRFETASELVSEQVGREMDISDIAYDSTVTNTSGSLSMSFTWTNFGEIRGDRLYVTDVFNGTAGETWFRGLEERQRLVMTIPAGYDLFSAPTATFENKTLRWNGPITFGPNYPSVIFEESNPITPPPTTTTTTVLNNTTTPGGDGTGDNNSWLPLVVVLIGAALAVVAYVASRSDEEWFPSGDGSGDDPNDGPAAADGPVPPDDDPSDPATETDADAAAAAAAASGESASEDPDEEIDEELLSDEERVERLLERNGGRMKQANIVSETGWSNAKVSQLLSAMAEAERIEKLRIGRENLISFPEENGIDDGDDAA